MIRLFPPPRAILIGVAYFVAAAASVRFTRFDGGVAFIWVANALLIVELSLRRPADWPATLACSAAASFTATMVFGLGISVAPGITLAMMLEAAGAAWLLRQVRAGRMDLGSMEGFIVFAGIAGLLAPALGAIVGAAVVADATGGDFWGNCLHWYVGHALGNILFAPVLILIMEGTFYRTMRKLRSGRRWEALLLSLVMIAVTALSFGQNDWPILFLPILPMMIAAFRFGRFGSAVAIVLLAVVGGALTLSGNGPVQLVHGSIGAKALFFQFYLVTTALLTLPVAAVLQQSAKLFRALRYSEARFRLIADFSSDVIFNVDPLGRFRYVSPSIVELTGYEPAALIGTDASMLVLPDDRADARKTHRRAMADPGATFIVEYRVVTTGGAVVWCETHTRGVTDEEGKVIGAVSQARNIAHHKTAEAELSRVAKTDALTGLVNRRVFDETLDQRVADVGAGRGHGCVAVLDLDFFKHVNDAHGHDAGDRVLRIFAKVAAASIRDDDLIARVGGEEFGMILWGADLIEARNVCERLRREVEHLSVATDTGASIGFTFSGGIARIEDGTREDIMRAADQALYRAKNAGRNRLITAD